jgi:hypothetical protein
VGGGRFASPPPLSYSWGGFASESFAVYHHGWECVLQENKSGGGPQDLRALSSWARLEKGSLTLCRFLCCEVHHILTRGPYYRRHVWLPHGRREMKCMHSDDRRIK